MPELKKDILKITSPENLPYSKEIKKSMSIDASFISKSQMLHPVKAGIFLLNGMCFHMWNFLLEKLHKTWNISDLGKLQIQISSNLGNKFLRTQTTYEEWP